MLSFQSFYLSQQFGNVLGVPHLAVVVVIGLLIGASYSLSEFRYALRVHLSMVTQRDNI